MHFWPFLDFLGEKSKSTKTTTFCKENLNYNGTLFSQTFKNIQDMIFEIIIMIILTRLIALFQFCLSSQ